MVKKSKRKIPKPHNHTREPNLDNFIEKTRNMSIKDGKNNNFRRLKGLKRKQNSLENPISKVQKIKHNSSPVKMQIFENSINKKDLRNDPEVSKVKEKQITENIDITEQRQESKEKVAQKKGVIKYIENQEKLIIKLVKGDKSSNEIDNATDDIETIDLCNDEILPKHLKPTKKICKSELKKHNLLNINKTESMKIEEMLLKKYEKIKENPIILEDDSFKPYIYEKTNKPVYETYKIIINKNGDKKLCCRLCPFIAERFRQISLHYKFKHHDTPIEEMHFCNIKNCKFKTVHQGMFKWHMRRHALAANDKKCEQYSCDQCRKVFKQRKGYLIHLKHMHKEPELLVPEAKQTVYPCSTCNFKTNIQRNLQMHIYRCHIPDNLRTIFNCNVCGFETYYRISLKRHLTRVHINSDF